MKNEFSVSELLTICNVLCVDNFDNFEELSAGITSCLSYLNLLKASKVHDDNSDIETEILSGTINGKSSDIVENSIINNATVQSISEGDIRSESGSTKNEMLLITILR